MHARIKPLTVALICAFTLVFASAAAQAQAPSKMKVCADQWNDLKAKNQTGNQTYQEFSKKCMSADDAAAPAAKPATTTATPPKTTAPATTAAPAAKPAATAKPTPASVRDDEEESGTNKEDLAKCNASWKDYKAKNNVTGAKAWHVFMARCLP